MVRHNPPSTKGSSSNNKDGKFRRHKGDIFRRGRGGGVLDHKHELDANSVEKHNTSGSLKEDDETATNLEAETDNPLLVTKEIASVRLDNPPHLELVVDSEVKGAATTTRPTKPIRRQRQLRNTSQFSVPAVPSKPVVKSQPRRGSWLFKEDLTEQPEPEEEITIQLEDGFLARYCILNRTTVEMFRRTFDAVDDEQKGFLSYQETLIGLRGVNQKLKDAEERYLYRVLELCGYNVRRGADFKLFAVLSALSQKITSLDSWMRNLIGRMDFKMLEMKMFLCKHLWECNVDRETNKISIEQLCVELRAGGVTEKHIDEVRQRLGWMRALDLLDFLTYIPLFIMLHTSIVDNPLDMSRTK